MTTNTLQTQLTIRANVDGANEVNQLATSLDNINNQLTQTTNPASNASTAIDNLGNQAGQSVGQTNQLTQAIRSVNAGIAGTSTPANNASNAISNLGGQMTQSAQSASQLGNSMQSMASGLAGLLGALGVGIGVQEIIQLSDEFNNLEARVRLATESGGDFNAAMASIREIADHTTMPLTATSDLFTKLTQATKELGYSQSEVLSLTKTISEAMAVSGGDMASMEAGLTQLAQGLSAGALRGDEFNSVVEQAPRLAAAMADGLGVTIGQLRAMAGEGKLTAEVVGNALKSQADRIAYEYSQMPTTVSGSLTVLKNNLMGFIGELDNELSSSSGLGNFILDIANNIKNIDPSVIDGLKNSLESVGVVAKVLLDSISAIPSHLGDVLGAMMGLEAGAGQVSLLQGLMNGLALTTGAVADGFKALQIVIYGVIAEIQTQIANLASALNMLTGFGGEFAKSMTENAKQAQAEFEKLAMSFESSLGKAMDGIGKTSEQKLQEVADIARQKYEQMAQDGTASTTALEIAFKDYAHKAIQANNGVVDEVLKQELAQKGLQAVVDDTGKVIIQSMQSAKQAVDDSTTSLDKHADSLKKLNLDMGEFMGGLPTKAQEAMAAFDELANTGKLSNEQLAKAYNATKQAIGDNKQAQTELNAKLLESVGGNQALANSILALADSQNKSATASKDNAKASENSAKTKETAKVATDQHTQSVRQNSTVLTDNTKAKTDNATATDQQTQSQSKAMAFGQSLLKMINSQSDALRQTTSDTTLMSQAFEAMKNTAFRGGVAGFTDLGNKIQNLGKLVKDSVNAFKVQEQALADASQSLSKADVSTQDLAKAQSVLNSATSFSIAGIIKLDKAKLDSLRQQIDSTKQKLNDLADTARQTRENMESELARMQGNEAKARQIEQQQKLKALEKQLKDAQKRGNAEEVAELQKALSLQKQIFAEQERQAALAKEQANRQTQNNHPNPSSSFGDFAGGGNVDFSQTAKDLTDIWAMKIDEAEKRGAENFAKQLIQESKRRAN